MFLGLGAKRFESRKPAPEGFSFQFNWLVTDHYYLYFLRLEGFVVDFRENGAPTAQADEACARAGLDKIRDRIR